MKKGNPDFWNERFGSAEYIYGKEPNAYLKTSLKNLTPGKILFPAEGEGRNAVYAAGIGWETHAFDPSVSGQKKALQLAEWNKVKIDYHLADVEEVEYPAENFDAIVLIYAHFHKDLRREYHRKLSQYLKKGGYIILEAFSTLHQKNQKNNPRAGGPKSLDMLYSLEEIKQDFPSFSFLESLETAVELKEGNYHLGQAHVVRILAQKL